MIRKKILFLITITFLSYSDGIVICKPEVYPKLVEERVISKLFTDGVRRRYEGKVSYFDSTCSDKECAISIAKKENAEEVIFSSIIGIGNKFIFSASITKKDGSNLFSQKFTTDKFEDFEELCDRMAEALINRKSLEKVSSIENITTTESKNEIRKDRLSYYSWGIDAGIGYPGIGRRSFKIRQSQNERRPMLFKLGWTNFWEFKNNLGLDLDLLCFLPASLGGDASIIYFFNKSDFSPFAGGGVGAHFFPDKYSQLELEEEGKRLWGPALNIQGGLMLFRTYNINLITRAQYHVVFTDDIDNGISCDLIFLLKSSKKDRTENKNGWDLISDVIKYSTIYSLVVTLAPVIASSLKGAE